MERDLVGYGKNIPRIEWPGGARIAVSVVVNYEEGAEYSTLDGDAHHETNGEVPSPVPPGDRDLFNESFFEYGSRVGVWRLLNMFDRYQVPATFFCCALALERNPGVAREIPAQGHEVCGHGYRWEEYHRMDREAEREAISKTVESLTRTTGERPVGWFTRYGPSVNTRDLVVAEGGFIYDSSAMNDDLPHYVTVQGKPWLVLPYSMETNDSRFWRGGLVSTNDFYDYLQDTFDCLYEEGASHPKMMSVGLHCRIAGRPARSRAVERFLRYAQNFSGVWFARRDAIAKWWLEHYPFPLAS
ncbi:MAG: chitin deacetylase [Candidatus Entotheonella factor]|uniref:Chitin deacetylase n=1 Tax=Entotheonella factor TaxID=1429438 RepID=W4LD20_ENTF1|nr:allantoinase PuuE [Candidatus Entotheonella palauensis]ETW95983.1 MAG: chitin deacetylase [Candidatus Entotheonella factor]